MTYQSIGRLLAEIIDRNCLAVVRPHDGAIYPFDELLETKLRSGALPIGKELMA